MKSFYIEVGNKEGQIRNALVDVQSSIGTLAEQLANVGFTMVRYCECENMDDLQFIQVGEETSCPT